MGKCVFFSKDHRHTSINIPKVNCDSGQKDGSTMEKFLWRNLEHMDCKGKQQCTYFARECNVCQSESMRRLNDKN